MAMCASEPSGAQRPVRAQKLSDMQVHRADSQHERGGAVKVGEMHVGVAVEKRPNAFNVAHKAGPHERRPPAAVRTVHVGSCAEQGAHALDVPLTIRARECCAAVRIRLVHIRAASEQLAHALGITSGACLE